MAKKKTTTKRSTKSKSPEERAATGVDEGQAGQKAGRKRRSAKKSSPAAASSAKTDTKVAVDTPADASIPPEPKKLAQVSATGGPKKVASASVLKGYDKAAAGGLDQGNSLSESQLRRAKSGLTRKDLNRYRKLLLDKRAEILGDVASLESDVQNGSSGGISYEHMADAGSDNFEQEFTLGLVESERKLLVQINDALLRMRKGIYGVCLERGVPIGTTRLDAKPWAKWCIEVVREKEKLGLR